MTRLVNDVIALDESASDGWSAHVEVERENAQSELHADGGSHPEKQAFRAYKRGRS
jgi:hypothetical protein